MVVPLAFPVRRGTRSQPGWCRAPFQPADDVLGQHANDQVAVLLEFEVFAAVSTIGLGVLKVVVAVDLDDEPQGSARTGRSRSSVGPERKPERRVEPEEPGGLGQPRATRTGTVPPRCGRDRSVRARTADGRSPRVRGRPRPDPRAPASDVPRPPERRARLLPADRHDDDSRSSALARDSAARSGKPGAGPARAQGSTPGEAVRSPARTGAAPHARAGPALRHFRCRLRPVGPGRAPAAGSGRRARPGPPGRASGWMQGLVSGTLRAGAEAAANGGRSIRAITPAASRGVAQDPAADCLHPRPKPTAAPRPGTIASSTGVLPRSDGLSEPAGRSRRRQPGRRLVDEIAPGGKAAGPRLGQRCRPGPLRREPSQRPPRPAAQRSSKAARSTGPARTETVGTPWRLRRS